MCLAQERCWVQAPVQAQGQARAQVQAQVNSMTKPGKIQVPIEHNFQIKKVPFWVKPSFYIFLLYIHILLYVYFRIMSLYSAYKMYR